MAPKPCPNMRRKAARRACPKFEQDSPFDLDVKCCRKTPPKPLDSYKACPSPTTEIKSKKGCGNYAVRSRLVRSKKLCCRKTKPSDGQKVLNTLKVARHFRHLKPKSESRSGSLSSIDTPHVSEDGNQNNQSPKLSSKKMSSKTSSIPSHVSTPRFQSGRSSTKSKSLGSVAKSEKKESDKSKKSGKSVHVINAGAVAKPVSAKKSKPEKSRSSHDNDNDNGNDNVDDGNMDEIATLLSRLKMRSGKKKSSVSQDAAKLDEMVALLNKLKVRSSKEKSKKSSKKAQVSDPPMPVADYNHFLELMATIVDDKEPGLVNEEKAMNLVDSPHGLSPDEYNHFLELYNDFEAQVDGKQSKDSPNGLSPEEYDHFLELYADVQGNDNGNDNQAIEMGQANENENDQDYDNDGQAYDDKVKFKDHARFALQDYLKKHRADIEQLRSQIPGSDKRAWYIDRAKPEWYVAHSRPSSSVARIEVAALLDIIMDMEGGQVTKPSVASRLLKIVGMDLLPNSKVPTKYFSYQNLRLPRVNKYMRTVLGLANIDSATDATKVWREVNLTPEGKLMTYFMVGLIEHAVIRQNNDNRARELALGDVLIR